MNFPVFSQLAGNFGDGFLFIAADTETICCTRFANRSASHASKNCLATAVIFAMSSPSCLRVVAGLAPIGPVPETIAAAFDHVGPGLNTPRALLGRRAVGDAGAGEHGPPDPPGPVI